ncbi:helix-turn-helix domain-containing protein [Paenibacillus thailandensis]|uniref:Helix-turn-helix domain-containing protein n=1 Tax=Paenibacillus thailandensis TaxID=393250 RepID=A0ABW5R575_9BACL
MALEWRLRQVMAERGIWTGAELIRLMEEKAGYSLSAPSISLLLSNAPKQVKADTMDALCTALDCNPSDLWRHKPTFVNHRQDTTTIVKSKVANDRLPPI